MLLKHSVFVLVFGLALAAVTKKERVIDQKLSDKTPGSPDYDSEAFLGKEQAQNFKDLAPEESKRRLGVICDKVDKDGDGNITKEELSNWIVFTQTRYIREDAERQFDPHDSDKDGKISWEEYKKQTYGFLDDENIQHEDPGEFSYAQMMQRDERRWKKADQNEDGHCDVSEFKAFLHPEEFEHMKDIVILETLDDIDKDKDGFVSLDEYINDMHKAEEGADEPEWVEVERKQFTDYRDSNKDGKMDAEELRQWILPQDYNHADAEANHLIYETDDNKDGVLTKDEIINHHDKFVGSQATDWGEALTRHDEF